jgi:hypothetical protein
MKSHHLLPSLALLLAALTPVRAEEPKSPQPEKRVAVAKCLTKTATLIRREALGQPWQIIAEKEDLFSGDLILALPGAELEPNNGTVHMSLLADLDHKSPYPIRETAVILHDNPAVDLDFTLDRGRVDVINKKAKGAAKLHVRVRDQVFEVTLDEPGDRVGLEEFSGWPRGSTFKKDPKPTEAPVASLIFLALKGSVGVKHVLHFHGLQAPPGPALLEWDSVDGLDLSPQKMDKLPDWANAEKTDTPDLKHKRDTIERIRSLRESKGIDGAITELLKDDDFMHRRAAILILGAQDDLPRLGEILSDAKNFDLWDSAVKTLRHWIGRGPGQDQKLYHGLIERKQFTPVQAETVLELLHDFGDKVRARPEIYEVLFEQLDSDKLALRGLAYWHLSRLMPEGKKFGYNPVSSKEERAAAIKEWRKLIPDKLEAPAKGPGNEDSKPESARPEGPKPEGIKPEVIKGEDHRLVKILTDLTNEGVELYNSGDHAGCYHTFRALLLAVKPMLEGRKDLQDAIDRGLAGAAGLPEMYARAYALRATLDEVRETLDGRRKPEEKKPEEKK